MVKTAGYQDLLAKSTMPSLATHFLCASAVLEHTGRLADAGWQAVYAAWACDDAGRQDDAVPCRQHALELMQRARESGQAIAEQPGEAEAWRRGKGATSRDQSPA